MLKKKKPGEKKADITARINKNNVLCQLHFEDSEFTNVHTKRRLKRNAVPTLFNIPNPPKPLHLKRNLPTRTDPPQKAKKMKLDKKHKTKGDKICCN